MELSKILEILKNKGVTAYTIAQQTNLTEVGAGKILKGITKKPHKNTLNELTSYAISLVSEDSFKENLSVVAEPDSEYRPTLNHDKKGAPYYDVDFIGGFDSVLNDNAPDPQFYIDFQPYNDVDCWVNITGKSMSPFISHGDILALKRMNHWNDFLLFGEIYAVFTDEYRTVKIIGAGDDPDHYALIPYNKSDEFSKQPIPKRMINHIFRVKGSIKRFF